MTSSHPANPALAQQSGRGFEPLEPTRGNRKARSRGFTLIELLVVIGIILVLLGLLLPMLNRAYRNARRARMQSDLHVIALALEAYRRDFKDYPRTDPNDAVWGGTNYAMHLRGASLLCWALVAPGDLAHDGADGSGFRLRTASGQIYGPYVNPDALKVVPITGGTVGDDHYYFLSDTNGYPYLYYPANMGATITAANGYVGSTSAGNTPMYDTDDNDIVGIVPNFAAGLFVRAADAGNMALPIQRLEVMLGDSNANGQIDSGESPKSTGPYLLWGLGPDDLGGPDVPLNSSNTANAQSITQCDDVTNIP